MQYSAVELARLQGALGAQGARWRAGETSVSHLSDDQQRVRLGVDVNRVQQRAGATAEAHARLSSAGYPADFDWRSVGGNNYITGVKDQGGCGSCVAFGTVAAIEGTFQVDRANPNSGVDLSEAEMFYCYGAADGATCETGWWPDHAFDAARDQGLADAACFPYTPGDQKCNLCSDAASRSIRITAWHSLTDVSQMKAWIASGGPMSTCFTVYEDFFAYTSGVYKHVSGGVAGGHCVSVVGYSDTGGFWVCKNSWGTGWGEGGFFCIEYGDCNIDAQMWAVDGILNTGWLNNATITGLWSINQDRNAWVYVAGVGWRKLSPDNTNILLHMLTQLTAAKAAGRPVNLYQDNGVITQLYVL